MLRSALVAAALCLAITGCAGDPDPAPGGGGKLHRFAFKDLDANAPTGGALPGEDCELVAGDGMKVRLSDYRGRPLVLVFNRGFAGYICPYCTTYTAQLASRYHELQAAGAELLLVYPTKDEDAARIEEFKAAVEEILREEGAAGLPFPVFLDPGLTAVRRFNLSGDLSKPSTFVLDAAGKVRYAYVGNSPDERPSVDRVLLEARAAAGAGS